VGSTCLGGSAGFGSGLAVRGVIDVLGGALATAGGVAATRSVATGCGEVGFAAAGFVCAVRVGVLISRGGLLAAALRSGFSGSGADSLAVRPGCAA
jgi:hypothetical protein